MDPRAPNLTHIALVLVAACNCDSGLPAPKCDEACAQFAALCDAITVGECLDECRGYSRGERRCIGEATSCEEASSFCLNLAICGNGFRDRGEQCDDGNDNDMDGCDRNCRSVPFDSGLDTFVPRDAEVPDAELDARCPLGESYCDELCIPTQDDLTNCGDCDVMCAPGESCLGGRCLADRVLEFVLSWDRPGDVDLHVLRPDGEEIYFGRKQPPLGPDGLDGDLDADDISGIGPERVGFDMPSAADFIVCVNPYGISAPTGWTLDVREAGVVQMSVTGADTDAVGYVMCTLEGSDLVYSYTP